MKIIVVSDSHGSYEDLKKLRELYKDDIMIHLGDIGFNKKYLDEMNIIYVSGNCDPFDKPYIVKEIDNKRFLITHGHLYNVKYDLNNLYFKALEENCNYVLYGHTHHESIIEFDGIKFINPGAFKDFKYAIIINDKVILKKEI
jgi:putative phosphoesterase